MAVQRFVHMEVDPGFKIHTSYHNDFFILRTVVLVNGESGEICSIKEGSCEVLALNFSCGISAKLWVIVNTLSPVLHRYGVYHVDTYSHEQSPLFHVVFSSESCLQKFLHAIDEITSALESQLLSLFSRELKNLQGDVLKAGLAQCLNVKVQPDLFLVSPNHQKTDGAAELHLVTAENCSTFVTRWKDSKLFDFGALFQKEAETPRIISQPKELRDVSPGKSVTFTVEATGTKPFSYQWQWRPAGRGRRHIEWQNLFCDGSLFQEVEDGGLKLTRVMACNAGYYQCIVSNCAGSETSQCASLTVVIAASTPLGLEWLDTLEGEFDSVFRELHLGLSSLSPGEEEDEDEASLTDSLSAMASVFTQLVSKTKAVFQTNCKLEALLHNAHSELIEVKSESGRLARELQGRTLQVRSLEVQQGKQHTEHDDTARELSILRAQLELEIEQYKQGGCCQEKLQAKVFHLEEENSALHQYVHSLHADVAASSLAATYLRKELAGRIQQLQLLVKGIRGPSLKKLWQEINTEISLQQNKSLKAAYHSRDKVVDHLFDVLEESLPSEPKELRQTVMEYGAKGGHDEKVPERRQVREVTISKGANNSLGMSVTGGKDHGSPILIYNMEKGMPAYESGKLQIGDAILSVNGESLIGKTHSDAVKLLKSGGSEIRISVAYVVGVTAPPEGNDNSAKEDETKLNKPPVVASISESSSLELKAILDSKVRVASHSTPQSNEVPSPVDENSSRPSSAVSPYERLASSFGLHPTPLLAQSKTCTTVSDMGLFRYDEVEEKSPLSTPTGNSNQTPHFSPVTPQIPLPANDGAELDRSHVLDPPSRTSTLERSTSVANQPQVESCSATDSNGHKTAYTPTSMSLPEPSLQSSQHNSKTLPSDHVSKDTATETKYSGIQDEVTPTVQSPYQVRIAAFNIQGASNEEELPLFCGSIDV